MNWCDIPWRPARRTLRQFAGLWIVCFAGLASWHGWIHVHPRLAVAYLIAAVTVGPLGLVKPEAIRPIFVGWMAAVFPVGWIVSRLVLAVLFYGLFTPVGLIFRLVGRDALCRSYQPETQTYWTQRPMTADMDRYFRSF
jgi:Saxitoxin biosynthesis operon protein SxtJ